MNHRVLLDGSSAVVVIVKLPNNEGIFMHKLLFHTIP